MEKIIYVSLFNGERATCASHPSSSMYDLFVLCISTDWIAFVSTIHDPL